MGSGSLLMDRVNERFKKAKIVETNEEFEVMYPTGFASLDCANGTMVHVCGNGIDMKYRNVGIVDGSSNMFIGRSNCGKSTLATQCIGNIARQFPNTMRSEERRVGKECRSLVRSSYLDCLKKISKRELSSEILESQLRMYSREFWPFMTRRLQTEQSTHMIPADMIHTATVLSNWYPVSITSIRLQC